MIKKRGTQEFIKSYRPMQFSEMHKTFNKKALITMLNSENQPHVYGFFGLSGSGKTTAARICSLYINCLDKKDNEPCLECRSCKAILNNCPDVVEVNVAGDSRKIQETENLISTFQYNPRNIPKKIIILDEIHKMTSTSQNALLKVLEEERNSIYFFFCTTEKKGIIPALLRRITGEIEFKGLNTDDKVDLFVSILNNEKFEADTDEVLKVLEKIGDAPGIVVKAAHNFIMGNTDIGQEEALEADVRELCKKIIKGDTDFIKYYINNIKSNKDNTPEKVRLSVSGYFKGCLVRSSSVSDIKKFTKALDYVTESYFANDAENRLLANLSKCFFIFGS